MSDLGRAVALAGIAEKNPSLFRRVGVALGDPACWIQWDQETVAIVRDLEMDRVRKHCSADRVLCPADLEPDGGLDADRETATAQAAAEYCFSNGMNEVTVDRTFPFIYANALILRGISIRYDADLGVLDRRQKTEQEIEWLSEAQSVTEAVMRQLCEMIANSDVASDGALVWSGETLTSERVRSLASTLFLERDYSMTHGAIAASAPHVGDCHHRGLGPIRTGESIVIDLFPMNNQTRYWGDCTRTVVHGEPTPEVRKMHAAVVRAKSAAEKLLVPGKTADQVHRASEESLVDSGYASARGTITEEASIQHGTGHGIGLDVHEPILLDFGGGALLSSEVFTVEPGLYGRSVGGVRVEDMLVVRDGTPQNLNQLHEGLEWK